MSQDEKKRWLVKDRDGRVKGPYLTDEVLRRIKKGEMTGEEYVSLYPSTEWIPISSDPTFYDRLLESLKQEELELNDDVVVPDETIDRSDRPDEFVESRRTDSGTASGAGTGTGSGVKSESSGPQKTSRVEKVSSTKKPVSDEDERSGKATKESSSQGDVIELKRRKKVSRKQKAKKSALPTFVLIGAVIFVVYIFFGESGGLSEGRIHFSVPRTGQQAASPDQVTSYIGQGLSAFFLDSFSNYKKAQDFFVRAVEGDNKNSGGMAILCMTYHELWPFAYQDAKDLEAVSVVTQMVSKINPASVETSTCRMVDFLLRGKVTEAKGLMETVLETFGGSGEPPVAFYYFKSLMFEMDKDYRAAIDYATSSQQVWSSWLRLFYLEARLLEKNQDYQRAASRYASILNVNPGHQAARIELGLIEYRFLKNYQKGKELILQGIQGNDRVANEVLAKGYVGLAEIYMNEKNSKDALDYALKAYEINPTNSRAKEIIELIDKDKLKSAKIQDSQLISEGDQHFREGNYNAAQAVYKAAYERNKKNGLAAQKAAEALWAMSFSSEAIDWLGKAIAADPQLIDAYVLMADYFSQRFNFGSASQILNKARETAPQSYKVYRGYALVELRRNSAVGASSYAQKAIDLYSSDVESYVILARAQMKLNEASKAYSSASRAVEIDQNNREAQIVYAEALGAARGNHVGIEYLSRLVETYPTITAYRMALGQMFMKDQSFGNAERVFRQIIQIEEKPKAALIALGEALQMQRRNDEAVDTFFKAAFLDPADVEPIFKAGLLYLDVQKPTEARQQFNRVLKINKDYPLVNYYIGRTSLMLNDYEDAIQQANVEKARNPNIADPYVLLAEIYTAQKQYTLCASEYQQALKLRPQDSDISIKMARCYRMSGNLDVAKQMINQASQLESGNPEIWKEMGAIYETLGESVRAIEAYSQYLVLAPNAPDRAQIEGRIGVLSRGR